MKVIIAGGRDFDNYTLLVEKCDKIFSMLKNPIIISGTARGADKLGEKYAQEKGYKVVQYPANWEEFGKKAGILRNVEMAKNSDALVCFWDGKSRGTKHMIETAEKLSLKIRIIKY